MTFTHPQGTRGAAPPGRFLRWMNKLVTPRARRSDKPFMGMDVLVLVTVGRTSGQERSTPVAWFADDLPDARAGWLVVASAGGAASNPDWYRNLAAHPDQAAVELGGRRVPVTATELHGDERAAAWTRITEQAKQFAGYERKTDRLIPVIRLTPHS